MKAICKKLPHTILVIGPSGSGKDTQIDLLAEKCECEKIGTGDMFRLLYKQKVEGSEEAYEFVKRGEWVPDRIVYKLLPEWLKQYDTEKAWIFSQVVRTVPQIVLFDQLIQDYSRTLDKVIYFSLSDKVAVERMSWRRYCSNCEKEYHLKYKKPKCDKVCDDCGSRLISRDDDNPESILRRLNEFRNKTSPIIDIYSDRKILIEIDASLSIEVIHNNLISRILDE